MNFARAATLVGTWHMLWEMWSWHYMTGKSTLHAGALIKSVCAAHTSAIMSRLCNHSTLTLGLAVLLDFFFMRNML